MTRKDAMKLVDAIFYSAAFDGPHNMTANELLRLVGGSTETDWFALSISQKAECLTLAKQCRYRQTPHQKAMGRSRAYSFYLSLQRKAARLSFDLRGEQ